MSARPRYPQANELANENERLRRELAEKEQQIRKLAEEVAEQRKNLERQLALRKPNSTNSSKPPSSDGLAGEARERGRWKN